MLSAAQIEEYRENGAILVSGIFTQEELDRLEAEFDGIIERRLANKAQLDATWAGDWNKGQPKTSILHTHDVQAYSAEWAKVLVHDRFTEAISDCMGSPNVQLHHTKLFQKPRERGSGFPMHQDHPYFPHENHTMMAGIIHLSDATEEMGCVRVYPGTHKLGPLPSFEHNHLNPAEWPLEKATPCPAKRGDVLFFNYLTIHGSGINSSEQLRKTVLVQVRDPLDRPVEDTHRSHAQGLIMRGIHPLLHGEAGADGTLGSGKPEVEPAEMKG
jgi:phytanoyl-CoA hydroxylase